MSESISEAASEEVPAEELVVSGAPVVIGGEENNEPAVQASEEIQIGDKVFTSSADAITYAKQLQSTVATNDAYQQGINDAIMGQQSAPSVTNEPVVEQPLFDETEFYENPQAVIKKVMSQATDSAVQIVRNETAQKAKTEGIWNDFYSKYPRLQKSDKMVRRVLEDNWSILGNMADSGKAMDILAQKATDEIKVMLADFMPSEELPLTKQATSPGGQVNVTHKVPAEPVLDFVKQATQHFKL